MKVRKNKYSDAQYTFKDIKFLGKNDKSDVMKILDERNDIVQGLKSNIEHAFISQKKEPDLLEKRKMMRRNSHIFPTDIGFPFSTIYL